MLKLDASKTPIMTAMEAKLTGIKADAEKALTPARVDQTIKALSASEIKPEMYKIIVMMLISDGIQNHPASGLALQFAISIPTAQAIIDDLAAGIMAATPIKIEGVK